MVEFCVRLETCALDTDLAKNIVRAHATRADAEENEANTRRLSPARLITRTLSLTAEWTLKRSPFFLGRSATFREPQRRDQVQYEYGGGRFMFAFF